MSEPDFSISPVWIDGVPLLPKKEGKPHWTRCAGNWYGAVPQPDGTNEYHCRGGYLIPWPRAASFPIETRGSTTYYEGAFFAGSVSGGWYE